jgi:hypothetical protein
MAVLGAAAAAEIGEDAATEEDAGATEDCVVEDGAGADDGGAGAEVEVRREAIGVKWAVVLDVTAAASTAPEKEDELRLEVLERAASEVDVVSGISSMVEVV